MDRVNIHCAGWVVPITAPLIQDGAVVIKSGIIIDFGPREKILANHSGHLYDHGLGAILPAMANTHLHLELSALRGKIRPKSHFVDWLRDVIQLRSILDENEITESIKASIKELTDSGTLLMADVTNSGLPASILKNSSLKGMIFLELLGFNRERGSQAFVDGKSLFESINASQLRNFSVALSPHAVYSVHRSLFQLIKEYNMAPHRISSVHLAESKEESEFLQGEESLFKEFLMERAVWEKGWDPPLKSPVSYLDELGFLDEKTICVHLTQVDDKDIKILASRKVRVSLCLRSNLKTGVGLPPVMKFLQEKLLVSLGTDSLASNDDLNIFGEMLALRRHFPLVPVGKIFEMATLNGAEVLDMGRDYGSIEKGKRAPLLFVDLPQRHEKSVLDSILEAGYQNKVSWLPE